MQTSMIRPEPITKLEHVNSGMVTTARIVAVEREPVATVDEMLDGFGHAGRIAWITP